MIGENKTTLLELCGDFKINAAPNIFEAIEGSAKVGYIVSSLLNDNSAVGMAFVKEL